MTTRTFDVDWERLENGFLVSSEHRLDDILRNVYKCPYIAGVEKRRSASGNGYHVRVRCVGEESCYTCRLLFDSPFRLQCDSERPRWTREVLWDVKQYKKQGRVISEESGPWEAVP